LLLIKDGLGHCQQQKLCRAFVVLSEGGKYSFFVRLTFWGTEIVAPVHVVHPLRQGFAFPNKLVPSKYKYCTDPLRCAPVAFSGR
jgi:hypothetical protein